MLHTNEMKSATINYIYTIHTYIYVVHSIYLICIQCSELLFIVYLNFKTIQIEDDQLLDVRTSSNRTLFY